MKLWLIPSILFVFLLSCGSTAVQIPYDIPMKEINDENKRWESLGVDLRGESVLLDQPFSKVIKSRLFIVPQKKYLNWISSDEPELINRDDFLMDLSDFEIIMKDGYGGWPLAENKGWDWKKFFMDWRNSIVSKPEKISLNDALSYFGKFKDFQRDNHTGFLVKKRSNAGSLVAQIKGSPDRKCSALVDSKGVEYEIVENDLGQQPKSVKVFDAKMSILSDSRYIVFPWNKRDVAKVKCGNKLFDLDKAWQPLEDVKERSSVIKKLSLKDPRLPSFRNINKEIGYLRLPTFSSQNTERLQKLAKELPATAGEEKLLIIDMRMNDGGNGESSFVVLKRWIDLEKFKKAQQFQSYTVQSCTARSLRWGYTQISTMRLKPPNSDYQKRGLQKEFDDLIGSDNSCGYSLEKTTASWSYSDRDRGNISGKRFLILVDNFCGSDCEYMTHILGSLSETIIAGHNTYGVMQFIQPGYSILPRTGVPFRLARGISDIYGDNRVVDGHGLDVDILLPNKKEMSRDGVLSLVELLLKKQ